MSCGRSIVKLVINTKINQFGDHQNNYIIKYCLWRMSRLIQFKTISYSQSCLFDTAYLALRFNSSQIPIIKSKASKFQFNYHSHHAIKHINSKIGIPYTSTKCELIVHLTIINLKTLPAIITIEFKDGEFYNKEIQSLNVQTQLGELCVGFSIQEQNYLPDDIQSQISNTTFSQSLMGSSIVGSHKDEEPTQSQKKSKGKKRQEDDWLQKTKKKGYNDHSQSDGRLFNDQKRSRRQY